MISPTIVPLTSLPPQLLATLKEETDRSLQNIINANITSRYASSSSYLADFRSAIALDKNVNEDSTLSAFRRLVPLTDYEVYSPWIAKFLERPCKLLEVENLLAPGLPRFIAVSSSTSSNKRKHFARYVDSSTHFGRPVGHNVVLTGTKADVYSTSYRGILEFTTYSGEVAKRIPICTSSAGTRRISYDWPIETDDTRMAYKCEHLTKLCNKLSLDLYLCSFRLCCSVGGRSHNSPSIFPPNPWLVHIGRSNVGANFHNLRYLVHGSGWIHPRGMGNAPVQHTTWGDSGC